MSRQLPVGDERVGMSVAQVRPRGDFEVLKYEGDKGDMKEVAQSFAQLAAIIMLMITLAISTASLVQ
jgi:hypothetical protein